MREDGFGDAGYVITPDLIVSQSSGEWLDAKLEQLCLEPPRADSKIPHRSLLDVLRRIAGTPKAGEPCPDDPTYSQTWHEDGGKHAIDVLHHIIDAARSALAGAGAPASPHTEQLRTANSELCPAPELATGTLEEWDDRDAAGGVPCQTVVHLNRILAKHRAGPGAAETADA